MWQKEKLPFNAHLVVLVAVVALPLAVLVLTALALFARFVLRMIGVF